MSVLNVPSARNAMNVQSAVDDLNGLPGRTGQLHLEVALAGSHGRDHRLYVDLDSAFPELATLFNPLA